MYFPFQECQNTQHQRSFSKGSAVRLLIFGVWDHYFMKWSLGFLLSFLKI